LTWETWHFSQVCKAAPLSSFIARLQWFYDNLDLNDFEALLGMVWAIWIARNLEIYGNSRANSDILVVDFIQLIKDYKVYTRQVYGNTASNHVISLEQWTPPPIGWIKINTDATLPHTGCASLGWVARHSNGNIIGMGVKRLCAPRIPDLAEAEAMRFALLCAQEAIWRYVICESDALSLISRLQSGSKGRAPSDLVLDDIRNLVSSFSSLLPSHVKRLGNTVAHFVARLPPNGGDVQVCKSHFPTSVCTLASLDMK